MWSLWTGCLPGQQDVGPRLEQDLRKASSNKTQMHVLNSSYMLNGHKDIVPHSPS
jgi:hypothetical protein